MTNAFYPGRRLSYDGSVCTVRYVGDLEGTKGQWLGVEWDDPSRGKHDGKHRGQQIFQCLCGLETAASFVKSSRRFDTEQTVIQAIKSKYGSAGTPGLDVVVISGKVAEEVGFDKIAQEQSRLADLRIVLIDKMVVNGIAARSASADEVRLAQEELRTTCPNITELNLGWNTFESWTDVALVCAALPKLKVLNIGGSRFSTFVLDKSNKAFANLTQLSLESCWIRPNQLFELLQNNTRFASLQQLNLSDNFMTEIPTNADLVSPRLTTLSTLDVSNNLLRDLSCVAAFTAIFPEVRSISLQANCIEKFGDFPQNFDIFAQVQTLNLSQNKIPSFGFIDELPRHFPNLRSLHITHNPFFRTDHATASVDPKAIDKKYYLTLARLASLQVLNYTRISARDREEGEIYYLSVADEAIREQIDSSQDPVKLIEHAKQLFPRYEELAQKYGNDSLAEKYLSRTAFNAEQIAHATPRVEYPAGSLGARIVTATFYMTSTTPTISAIIKLPSTIPVTQVMAFLTQHVAFKHRIRPLRFRLIYESNELDPVDTTTESTTRSVTYGRRLTLEQKRVLWQEWGNWDADAMVSTLQQNDANGSGEQPLRDGGEHWTEDGKFYMKAGRRFRLREVEIPPALKRPWGDWLDGSKQVRIRIEPS